MTVTFHRPTPHGKPWLCMLFVIGSLVASAFSSQIIWRSAREPHKTSFGQPLDASFVFELGVFRDGFVPSLANVEEWAQHWEAAQRTPFDVTSSFYTNRLNVDDNPSPFFVGTKGYVWGFGVDTQEFILMSGTNWSWPRGGGTSFPRTWTTLTADEIVVGSLFSVGSGTHLQTQDIGSAPSPILGPMAWQEDVFSPAELANPAVSDWLADPDHDGYTNLDEYALEGNPLQPEIQLGVTVDQQSETLEVTLTRQPTRFATTRLQTSLNLINWELAELPPINVLADELNTQRITVPMTPAFNRWFVRVQVEATF